MRIRKGIKVAVMLFGLALASILFFGPRPSSPLRFEVLFAGYTNDTAGARIARFRITNQSGVEVVRWGFYTIQAQQEAQVICPSTFKSCSFLAPGQSEVVTLQPPETKGPWKASISCARRGLQVRWAFLSGRLPQRICDAIPERFRDVPKENFASDWIK